MLRKISLCLVFTTSLLSLTAQDVVDSAKTAEPSPKTFAVSGYVDAYYRFNFSNPKKESETFNNNTSFTNSQNSFELGMASVKLEHSMGKVGVVADIGFGKRAEEFSYNDASTMVAIKQAYVTYAPSANLKLTAGSWGTHIGYELVDPYLNRNYSMSYMFSWGPFFHTGLKADITSGKSGFMIGLANPTDLKSASVQRKFLIGQYSYGGDKVKLYLNYQGGTSDGEDDEDSKIQQGDIVITGAVSDKFSIGYNGTLQSVKVRGSNKKFGDSDSWWGSA
ncbi:MAG TPA: outer membrane beta-barrel protein, partial [Chitinophagaceae bacterium]|nr:outer membrane beta-barrel protein [Chitinophagaceae bacterium]